MKNKTDNQASFFNIQWSQSDMKETPTRMPLDVLLGVRLPKCLSGPLAGQPREL